MSKSKVIKNPEPIILANYSTSTALLPGRPILLLHNGLIACGDFIYDGRQNKRHYRRQYEFIKLHQLRRRRSLNITSIAKPDIYRVIDDMHEHRSKSISLNRLIDIFGIDEQIVNIRNSMIAKITASAQRKWNKSWHNASGLEKLREMHELEESRRKQTRKLEQDLEGLREMHEITTKTET